jgi:hypothetical protein
MPFDASRYPATWPEISLPIREREGWKGKFCGAIHGQPHPLTGSTVILTVAHLGVPYSDGTPGNPHDKMEVRDENLAALCQRRHLNYDRAEHMLNAAYTRWRKKIEARQLCFIIFENPRILPGDTMTQKPTPLLLDEQALIQLAEMETLIAQYLAIYAENTGSYDFDFSVFDPTLRAGLVYHRRGRGWKLRRTWRERLAQKRQALTGEFLGATLR